MRIPHFIIIGIAAGGIFAVGYSKSSTSSSDPIVTFQGYKIGSDGMGISKRILALLTWYGSGAGPWSGFPAYEISAEELLLDFSTTDLIAAIETSKLTDKQLEGAARLFGGWEFSQRRPNDLQTLPLELKKTLLKNSLKSTNTDKLERAKSAFGQP